MADSLLMEVLEALENLFENFLSVYFWVFLSLSDLIQEFGALDELHHLINLILEIVAEHLDSIDHIGMVKSFKNPEFLFMGL